MPARPPFPANDPFEQQRLEALYQRQRALDMGNLAQRGMSPGTRVAAQRPAGNIDGVHVTVSFGTATVGTQTATVSHRLGRPAVGFEVVQVNGPAQVYSAVGGSGNNATRIDVGAMVFDSPVTASLRIW